jgi:hypothetical protein
MAVCRQLGDSVLRSAAIPSEGRFGRGCADALE